MELILQTVLRRRFFVYSRAIRLPPLSLSFRAIVCRNQVFGQMTLELVAISYAFHAPDNQLLTQSVIHSLETQRGEGKAYLTPGIKVLHDLSRVDPTFDTLVTLGCIDFTPGRFPAQVPTEENSCACLFSS